MIYRSWGRTQPHRDFHEKAWLRKNLTAWEERWNQLTLEARGGFLTTVKFNARKGAHNPPSVPADVLPSGIVKELVDAGFAELRPPSPARFQRIFVGDEVLDFVNRARLLRRYHLLDPDKPSELEGFIDHCFYTNQILSMIYEVLGHAGIKEDCPVAEAVPKYIPHHCWPEWVAACLEDPLAQPILEVVLEADRPIRLAELPGRFEEGDPARVRATLDKLVTHLALFEDICPETWEVVVGLLPAVRAEILRSRQPTYCGLDSVCEPPEELGPEGGLIVNDMRVFLLELAGEPPRLRRDRTLFNKDAERFQEAFDHLPDWVYRILKLSPARRLMHTLHGARSLGLVEESAGGQPSRLHLTREGHQWLACPVEDQYGSIYRSLQRPSRRHGAGLRMVAASDDEVEGPGDAPFLGIDVRSVRVSGRRDRDAAVAGRIKPDDQQALRDALYRFLSGFLPGETHDWESVLERASRPEHNLLLMGLGPSEVQVLWEGRPIPSAPEPLADAAKRFLATVLQQRLVPLGCFRTGRRDDGAITLARTFRLEAYFGREWVRADTDASVTRVEARVTIQPDFSVVVTGQGPAVVAELIPFCERANGHEGGGSLFLKITRDSVVKAVAHGLGASEIVDRLRRHGRDGLPANVLDEVQTWCTWMRQVTSATRTLLHCADRETAERVTAALVPAAERLNDTMVAVPQPKLNAMDRQKLQEHGIIVQREPAPADAKLGLRKRRRRF